MTKVITPGVTKASPDLQSEASYFDFAVALRVFGEAALRRACVIPACIPFCTACLYPGFVHRRHTLRLRFHRA